MRHERMQRNDGDKWPAERTNAVDRQLVAAFTILLLERKLLL